MLHLICAISTSPSCSEGGIAFKWLSSHTTWDVLNDYAIAKQQQQNKYTYIDPVYAGRFLISKEGTYTLQFNAFSSGTTPTSTHLDVNLTIGSRFIDKSKFDMQQVSTKIITAVYSEYMVVGTYVYFFMHFNLLEKSSATNISISYNGGDFSLLKGSDCNKCYEGPGCTSDTQNPAEMCWPYTYALVDKYLLNSVARKSIVVASLFSLLL